MGDRAGQAAVDLNGALLTSAHRHHFYQLVERIHRVHDDNLETQLDMHPDDELIRYEADPALAFPASDVCRAGLEQDPFKYFIQITFMGMHGSASPLPHHYLESIAQEYHQGIGVRGPFFDFFNHRLITLLHRAWRKYRYYIRFRADAEDRFSQYLYSFIGLNDRELRGETAIPWSRLLTYAGMIATRGRAPSMISGIVAHCFDLDNVEVKEWIRRYVQIPQQQRNVLGRLNSTLGEDFSIGARVLTRSAKFVIAIKGLNQARFRDFLPSGKTFAPLNTLVDFLLRDQLAYDLQLGLTQDEIPPLVLDRDRGANLGWTAFLGKQTLINETSVNIRGRS